MNYNVRIDENFLKADFADGEVYHHTDVNELENVIKTAINANYEDIQKLIDGVLLVSNSEKLNGADLSTFEDEPLQSSDTKVPTSLQVKEYVDGQISLIDLTGYYTKREMDEILDTIDIEADKEGKITDITITHLDGTTDEVQILDGADFEYNWQGTSLGVKTSEQSTYQYVDLKGEKGDKGDMGDCNFATFNIDTTSGILYLNKPENLTDIDFDINSNGELEVIL